MGTVSSLVKKYVEQKDVTATRTALTTIGYIADYDSFQDFKSSVEYASDSLDDLFEEDDDKNFDNSVSVDSYKSIIKQMMDNFSKKKYDAAIKIGSSVFKPQTTQNSKPASEKLTKEDFVTESPLSKALKNPLKLIIAVIIVIAIIVILVNLLK